MKPILCAVLLMCACSRSSLKAIERMATTDATPPVDTSPPDTHLPDTNPPDMRLTDTNPPDMRLTDVRPVDTRLLSDTFVASDTRLNDTAPACPTTVAPQDGSTQTVMGRNYVLHIPKTYDGSRPVPLLLEFHALGVFNGQMQSNSSAFPAQTDPDGVIIAFPSGAPGPSGPAWNLGPCCVNDSSVDDVAFTKAMIAQIQKTLCIDTSRIYAVGRYTGGGMAYTLACRAADIFAGVAVSAWDLLDKVECKPQRPITVVSFRDPTDTGFIFYAGGYSTTVSGMPITFLGAQKTFQAWAASNGCTGSPSKEDANNCSTYPRSSCDEETEVVLCSRPGTVVVPSDASIAWPRLKQHTR